MAGSSREPRATQRYISIYYLSVLTINAERETWSRSLLAHLGQLTINSEKGKSAPLLQTGIHFGSLSAHGGTIG